jgi:hypothetical protein
VPRRISLHPVPTGVAMGGRPRSAPSRWGRQEDKRNFLTVCELFDNFFKTYFSVILFQSSKALKHLFSNFLLSWGRGAKIGHSAESAIKLCFATAYFIAAVLSFSLSDESTCRTTLSRSSGHFLLVVDISVNLLGSSVKQWRRQLRGIRARAFQASKRKFFKH